MIARGAQQIDNGIQRGLVKMMRARIHSARLSRMQNKLDYRKISSITIIENSINLSKNLAVLRDLLIIMFRAWYGYFFWKYAYMTSKSSLDIIISN
jgi:hypothetical protein